MRTVYWNTHWPCCGFEFSGEGCDRTSTRTSFVTASDIGGYSVRRSVIVFSMIASSNAAHRHQPVRPAGYPQGVSQRSPKPRPLYLHYVTSFQPHAVSKAEGVGAEKMHVHIARPAVGFEFKVVVLQVRQAVAHHSLAGLDRLPPQHLTRAFDRHLARHVLEIRVHHQLRTDGAGAQLRCRQVQVVPLLELVV